MAKTPKKLPVNILKPPRLLKKCKVTDLCRLCLNSTSNKVEIFGSVGKEKDISGTIMILFNSQVLPNDRWPQSICVPCSEILTKFRNFYSTVKSTESTLMILCGARKQLEENSEKVEYILTEEAKNHLREENEEMNKEKSSKVKQEVEEEIAEKSEMKGNRPKKRKRPTRTPQKLEKTPSKKRESMDTTIANFVELTCEQCLMNFQIFEELKDHYVEHHNQERHVKCCGIRFEQRQRLLEHISYHKNPDKYACKICGKGYKFWNSLQVHMGTHIAPEDREFKCNQCPKSYTKVYFLTAHQKTHIPPEEREYLCTLCNKTFPTVYVLRNHIKRVHESSEKKVCDVCAKVFKSKEGFAAHQLDHMEKKPPKLECEHCGKKYKHRKELIRHIVQHRNPDERFSCEICGRMTANRRALQNHKSYAHRNLSFKCNLCDKEFKRALNLKEHMASHSGLQSLYKCNFCDKMFNSNANKYVHQKRNHPDEWEEERKKKLENDKAS